MASSFIEDDGVKVWQPRPWARNVPFRPAWQDEVFPTRTLTIKDSANILWAIGVNSAGALQSTSGSSTHTNSDTFTRANGALGSSWTSVLGSFTIVSNEITVNSGTPCLIYYNAASSLVGVDQFSQFTVGTVAFDFGMAGPAVRVSSIGTGTGYSLVGNTDVGDLYLYRYELGVGTAVTSLGSYPGSGTGDVLLISASAGTITGSVNGTVYLTYVDPSPLLDGKPGAAGTSSSSNSLDSFVCGIPDPALIYLNDLRTDLTTWQLGITTAGALTTTSVTFDSTQSDQFTLVSSTGVTWYLHITSLGILRTDASENWVQLQGYGGYTLIDRLIAIRVASQDIQPATGATTTNNRAAAYWDADSFQNDQISEITLSAVGFTGGNTAEIGVAVRMQADGSMYVVFMDFTGSTTTLYLYKYVGATPTALASQVISGVAVGDTIAVSSEATTITGYYNGNALLTATDSSITSGQPGVYAYYTTTGDSPARGDDWNAGQFSGTTGELISYQDATLSSAYNYQIGTRIRRGVAGSTIGAHAIGSAFLRLDEEVAEWDYDPQIIGQLVFFKFTSFNLRGMQEENIANVTAYPFEITGNSLGLLTPGHSTYRPTSNPLTATDAGTTATISVASFTMRIPGQTDLTINSGSISGLAFNTLEYVYFDDPGFSGGTVAFQITTSKETALNGAGRFFVGSIYTPSDGAPDTFGNNDGGGGAQIAQFLPLEQSYVTNTQRNGVVSNPANAIDNNIGTYTTLSANDDATHESFAYIAVTATGPVSGRPQIQVIYTVPTNTNSGTGGVDVFSVQYSINGGSTYSTAFYIPDDGNQLTYTGQQYVAFQLPSTIENAVVSVLVWVSAGGSGGTGGTIEAHIYSINILGLI